MLSPQTQRWTDEELSQLLKRAIRIARSMDKDPEMESLAGEALLRAMQSYDPARGTKENWVHLLVKQTVIQEWRRRTRCPERTSDADWGNVSSKPGSHGKRRRSGKHIGQDSLSTSDWVELQVHMPEVELGPEEHDEEWQILVEHEVLGWCIDVIAARHDVTIYRIKKWLPEIELRFGVMLARQAGMSKRQIAEFVKARGGAS